MRRLTALLESECTRTLSRNMREAKNQDILMETMCNVLLERRMAAASAREVPEPAPARAAQGPAPPVVRAELGEWLCEACTLINKKEAAHWCEVCGAPRMNARCALPHHPPTTPTPPRPSPSLSVVSGAGGFCRR